MKAIAFYWDDSETLIASSAAQKKLMKQWSHTAKAFGITTMLVVGNPPLAARVSDAEMDVHYFDSYKILREAYQCEQFIMLSEDGTDIDDTPIPDTGIFMAGSNYSNPIILENDIAVSLKSDIPLWDVIAMGILLYRVYK